ncbi:MAG: hypothetical protein ABI127_01785 [Dokdonella sp.]
MRIADVNSSGEPEISEVRLSAGIEQDIRRLDIEVEYTKSVRVNECLGYRQGNSYCLETIQRRLADESFTQGFSLDQTHGVETKLIVLADIEDRNDMRMGEPRRVACFSAQALNEILACPRTGSKDLECDFSIKAALACPIDNAHAATSQTFEQLVITEFTLRRISKIKIDILECRLAKPVTLRHGRRVGIVCVVGFAKQPIGQPPGAIGPLEPGSQFTRIGFSG